MKNKIWFLIVCSVLFLSACMTDSGASTQAASSSSGVSNSASSSSTMATPYIRDLSVAWVDGEYQISGVLGFTEGKEQELDFELNGNVISVIFDDSLLYSTLMVVDMREWGFAIDSSDVAKGSNSLQVYIQSSDYPYTVLASASTTFIGH